MTTLSTRIQFPFAGNSPAVRQAIGAAIAGVENMIRDEVRKCFPSACSSFHDEVAQVTRIHLWQNSLPKFDATKNVKVSTFLCICIRNRVRSCLPKKKRAVKYRRKLPATQRLIAATEGDLHAPDRSADRAIARLAERIIEQPVELNLLPALERLLRAIIIAPVEKSTRQIAKELGYSGPSAFGSTFGRLKRRLLEIAESEFEAL